MSLSLRSGWWVRCPWAMTPSGDVLPREVRTGIMNAQSSASEANGGAWSALVLLAASG
jgi:hypothetical protein